MNVKRGDRLLSIDSILLRMCGYSVGRAPPMCRRMDGHNVGLLIIMDTWSFAVNSRPKV